MKKLLSLLTIVTLFAASLHAQNKIAAEDAAKHIGETVTITAKVFGGRYFETSKNPVTLLNLGGAYPNHLLTVRINQEDRKNFTYKPEEFFANKTVIVTGKVTDFKGKPEIAITQPDQIKVQAEPTGSGGRFTPLDLSNVCRYCDVLSL